MIALSTREMWDNRSGPRGAGNTAGSLTHSSDLSREGMAVQPTQKSKQPHDPCLVEGCPRPWSARGMCEKHYVRFMQNGHTDSDADLTVGQRFWRKVAKGGPDDCWFWRGSDLNSNGYARFCISWSPRRQRVLAHRYSYELANGPIEPGLGLMHSCDMPLCVNPAHLKPGTQLDNMRDALAKGRMNMSGLELGWTRKRRLKEFCVQGHRLPQRDPERKRRRCRECEVLRYRRRIDRQADANAED